LFAWNGGLTAAPRTGDVEDEIELAKMREIDPQSEPRLTEALRRLAASARQSAPPETGAGLLSEFRRHHTRRRRIRRATIGVMAACLTVAAGLVAWRSLSQDRPGRGTPAQTATVPEKQRENAAQSPPAHVAAAHPQPGMKHAPAKKSATGAMAAIATSAANRQFLALPGYDPAVPLDELHVVRVQLPASALWKMGAPISADADPRQVTADFVVSQDGTPYAVRLVQ
jgi:hypothetical protein